VRVTFVGCEVGHTRRVGVCGARGDEARRPWSGGGGASLLTLYPPDNRSLCCRAVFSCHLSGFVWQRAVAGEAGLVSSVRFRLTRGSVCLRLGIFAVVMRRLDSSAVNGSKLKTTEVWVRTRFDAKTVRSVNVRLHSSSFGASSASTSQFHSDLPRFLRKLFFADRDMVDTQILD
jgi:hypothetical protein